MFPYCRRTVLRTAGMIIASLLAMPMLLSAQVTAPDFSIVLFPDTQNEAQYYPNVLDAETQWVVDNRANLNIQAVLGLGDIVNDGASDAQQQNASTAITTLDNAGMPYFLAIGNHDYNGADAGAATRTATGFNEWFGPARYAGKSYYRGNYPTGSNENFYGVLTINGKQYLILVLEYYPRPAAVQWAAGILAANPDKEAIIVTHAYMYVDSTRVDTCDSQDMNPQTSEYGDDLWKNLISKYANVIMTVNGHFTGGLASRRADLGVNGNLVNEMFSNYQTQANGGNGWLRILTFHPSTNTIDVKTYSPYLQQYMTDSANQFTISYHNPGYQSGSGQITGRVRTISCSDLAGATVTTGSTTTTTDSTGHYSMTVSAPSSPTVTVTAPGQQTQIRTLPVNTNYATDSDFYLTSVPPPGSCTAGPVNQTVTICAPANNSTVPTTVEVSASSTDTNAPVMRMEIWLDGTKVYSTPGTSLDTDITMSVGTHRLVVVAAETDTSYFKASESVTASSTAAPVPTVQLTANPATITAGQSATLSWSSTDASSVTISGVGTFGSSGTATVSPTTTTTYTATASGSNGSATSTATVTVTAPPTAPTVQISADPTTMTAGQSSTLTWSSTNASSVTISGLGTFGPSGTTTVTPTATTTYTATANGSNGSATSKATVTVQSGTTACTLSTVNQTVTICSPANGATVASPVHVVAGSTDTTAPIIRMEIWLDGTKVYSTPANSIDTTVATSDGSHRIVVVAAESDTSYFKATEYITVSSSATATPTVQLTANPTTISAGQTSTLSWSSTNATSVTISGVGTFGASGTTTVSPAATTTYTATATGPDGTASASATVSVTTASTAPTVQLTADPSTVTAGQASTLSWSSTNASSVTISGVGTFAATGSTTVSPTATTTYTATANGASGTATATTTVTVQSGTAACTLSTVNQTVTICSPANGATVASPVHVVAGSTDTTAPVIRMEIWVDGVKVYSVAGNSLDTQVAMTSGTHRIVVVAAESDTSYFKAVEYITVQ